MQVGEVILCHHKLNLTKPKHIHGNFITDKFPTAIVTTGDMSKQYECAIDERRELTNWIQMNSCVTSKLSLIIDA